MQDITDGFDLGDDEKVIQILKKWNGGKLSDRLFTELANIFPTPCIETVVLRRYEGSIQALLIPRPKDDIVWKGMLHSPGGALRKADYLRADGDPFRGVFERVESQEIKNKFIGEPKFIMSYPTMTQRGPELVILFLARIGDNSILSEGSGWYDVSSLENLPNFLKHQLKAVGEAAKGF